MQKATHQFSWFVVSCSPRLRRGEHVEPFEKREGEMLRQRVRLRRHEIEERLYRRVILQGRWTHLSQRGVRLSPWRGTTPAAAFLSELKERHDLSEAELLVDGFGYLTALSRTDLSGQLEYTDRDKIEKWFQTLKMRVERFHNTWNGGLASAQRWLAAFIHYYNFQRPHQAIENLTPVEEVLKR